MDQNSIAALYPSASNGVKTAEPAQGVAQDGRAPPPSVPAPSEPAATPSPPPARLHEPAPESGVDLANVVYLPPAHYGTASRESVDAGLAQIRDALASEGIGVTRAGALWSMMRDVTPGRTTAEGLQKCNAALEAELGQAWGPTLDRALERFERIAARAPGFANVARASGALANSAFIRLLVGRE